jgi:hypothetical protein
MHHEEQCSTRSASYHHPNMSVPSYMLCMWMCMSSREERDPAGGMSTTTHPEMPCQKAALRSSGLTVATLDRILHILCAACHSARTDQDTSTQHVGTDSTPAMLCTTNQQHGLLLVVMPYTTLMSKLLMCGILHMHAEGDGARAPTSNQCYVDRSDTRTQGHMYRTSYDSTTTRQPSRAPTGRCRHLLR